jgi:hypothetical protein
MAKAKTTELAVVEGVTAIEKAGDVSGFVEQVDASWLEGVTVERVVTLEAGQGVRGVYLGPGAPVEVHDPVTGEVRELGTWRIEAREGIVLRLLDSAKLRREFPGIAVGSRVRVMRGGQIRTGAGRNVTDYIVAVER